MAHLQNIGVFVLVAGLSTVLAGQGCLIPCGQKCCLDGQVCHISWVGEECYDKAGKINCRHPEEDRYFTCYRRMSCCGKGCCQAGTYCCGGKKCCLNDDEDCCRMETDESSSDGFKWYYAVIPVAGLLLIAGVVVACVIGHRRAKQREKELFKEAGIKSANPLTIDHNTTGANVYTTRTPQNPQTVPTQKPFDNGGRSSNVQQLQPGKQQLVYIVPTKGNAGYTNRPASRGSDRPPMASGGQQYKYIVSSGSMTK